jgi:hypothetical protein
MQTVQAFLQHLDLTTESALQEAVREGLTAATDMTSGTWAVPVDCAAPVARPMTKGTPRQRQSLD